MADNLTVDNGGLTDYTPATDEVTHSSDTAHVQLVRPVLTTGAEGSKTVVDLPGDASNGLDVDVTRLPELPAGSNNIGDVDVLSVPAPLSTSGGGTEAAALRVTIASDSTGVVSVDDNGASLTVDAPVGSPVFVRLSDGTDPIATLPVSVAALPALAAGTNNIGDVDVLSVPAPLSTSGGGTEAAALRVTIASDSTGVVSVDDNGGSLTVDAPVGSPAFVRLSDGAAAITTLPVSMASLPALPAGTNNIGDVDVLTVPAPLNVVGNGTAASALRVSLASDSTGQVAVASIAAGDNNIGNVDVVTLPSVTLAAGTNTNEVVGDVAHDAAAAGNPVMVAGVAQAGDDTAPPNRVSAEGDATRLATDFDGAVYVRPHGPQIWSYHLDTSTAQTDTQVHASPGAGLSLYITSITFSSGSATAINLFFEEGSTKVLGPYYLEAVAGRGMHITFPTPKKITPATALTLTTSASIAHSVDVVGFVGQG